MNKALALKMGIASLLIVSAAGCGGGSSSTTATDSPAAGMWVGTTADNRAVTGLVFENGLYYVLYSVSGDPATIAGVIQGTGTTSGATFVSDNARDFNMEGSGVLSASVSASFAQKLELDGTLTYGPGLTNTFTSSYDSDYELTPSTAALAGTYSGEVAFSLGNEAATITVASDGSFSGTGTSGCMVHGTATPRAQGNAFVISLTFGGAPCYFANQTLTGIGYFDATAKRFYSATPNASRSDGVLFVGTKP